MAISEAFQNVQTVTATEHYLASDSTTKTDQTADGVYQCWVELNNLAAGDEYRLRVYEMVKAAGTSRVVMEWTFAGAQVEPLFVTPSLILLHGWEFSLQKLSGTDRSIEWSIRKVA